MEKVKSCNTFKLFVSHSYVYDFVLFLVLVLSTFTSRPISFLACSRIYTILFMVFVFSPNKLTPLAYKVPDFGHLIGALSDITNKQINSMQQSPS
jgi:hypothetical protein